MTNLGFKKAFFYMIFSTFWAMGVPSSAQTLSMDVIQDSGQNLQTSLVNIKAVDAPAFHMENGKTGVGSEERYGQGIIIDSAGIIATNRHIIGNAVHILVALSSGKVFEGKLLLNSEADLCLIKIDAPYPLRAISLADSSDIQIGINVIAVANAGLNPQRIRDGQIINVFKGMSTQNVELLEMNIPLKPGDSGGPVLNEQGSLLGLIMGKQISDPSKSYAIASNRIEQEYYKYRDSVLN